MATCFQKKRTFKIFNSTLIMYYLNHYIETKLSDARKMDVVVDYGGERFIIELKKWRGQSYHDESIKQLLGYMDKLNEDKGYLLTFYFLKIKKDYEAIWTTHENKKQTFEVRV